MRSAKLDPALRAADYCTQFDSEWTSSDWLLPLPADGWDVSLRHPWIVAVPHGTVLPLAGWKVHVSSSLDEAETTLGRAAKVLASRGVPFKVLRSRSQYLANHSKNASRVQSGKFITCYPFDAGDARSLMQALREELLDLPGQVVLTDRPFAGSRNVHYRYGGFTESLELTPDASAVSTIIDGKGKRLVDSRAPGFTLPAGVVDPFAPEENAGRSTPPSTLSLGRFLIESAISFSNSGGVYIARARNGRRVVIKEGRVGTGYCARGLDGATRVRTEAEQLRRASVASAGRVPRVLEEFDIEGHAFVAMTLLPGRALSEWLSTENPMYWAGASDREAVVSYLDRCAAIQEQLRSLVARLHGAGIAIGDLNSSNVIIDDNDVVRLVDFEVATTLDDRSISIHTPDFSLIVDPQGVNASQRDRFALACVIMALVHRSTSQIERSSAAADRLIEHLSELAGYIPEWLIAARKELESHITRHSSFTSVRSISDPRSTLPILEERLAGSGRLESQQVLASADSASMPFALGYGWAGAALMGSRSLRDAFMREAERMILSRRTPPSLYGGVAGVLLTAATLGDEELAVAACERLTHDWRRFEDDSIAYGRAGAVLALDRYNSRFPSALASNHVDQALCDWASSPHGISRRFDRSGLLSGLTGVALVALTSSTSSERAVRLVAEHCLHSELARVVTRPKGTASLQEHLGSGRLLPYFGTGSAGLLTGVLVAQGKGLLGDIEHEMIDALSRDLLLEFSISPGLMQGIGGVYAIHSAVFAQYGMGDHAVLKRQAKSIARNVVAFADHGFGIMNGRTSRLDMSYDEGVSGLVEALRLAEAADGRVPWFGSWLHLPKDWAPGG